MAAISQSAAWFRTEWTPWHTTVALVAVALVAGALPGVKMSLVVNGLFLASIIALGAIGLTLIFGILKFANVAHGDYMMMGAYVTFFIVESVLEPLGLEGAGLGPFTFGYPLLIALPIGTAIVAGGAILLDIGIYRRLRSRGVNVVTLSMASLGVAIALRGLAQILWTTDAQAFPRESRQVFRLPMDVRVPPDSLFIGIAAVALVAALYVVLTHTKMGKAMRATADNPGPRTGDGHQHAAGDLVDMGHRWRNGGNCWDFAISISGAYAADYGMEVPDSSIRGRDSGGHRKSVWGAGRRVRYRCDDGGVHAVDKSEL